jgi:hypothetical protein
MSSYPSLESSLRPSISRRRSCFSLVRVDGREERGSSSNGSRSTTVKRGNCPGRPSYLLGPLAGHHPRGGRREEVDGFRGVGRGRLEGDHPTLSSYSHRYPPSPPLSLYQPPLPFLLLVLLPPSTPALFFIVRRRPFRSKLMTFIMYGAMGRRVLITDPWRVLGGKREGRKEGRRRRDGRWKEEGGRRRKGEKGYGRVECKFRRRLGEGEGRKRGQRGEREGKGKGRERGLREGERGGGKEGRRKGGGVEDIPQTNSRATCAIRSNFSSPQKNRKNVAAEILRAISSKFRTKNGILIQIL